jgi:hypothetical protein
VTALLWQFVLLLIGTLLLFGALSWPCQSDLAPL